MGPTGKSDLGMASLIISPLFDECDPAPSLKSLKDIFFRTSEKGSTLNGDAREEFFYNWAGWYVEAVPKCVLLARNKDETVVGYLVGCLNSRSARALFDRLFYYKAFANCYAEYPCHFHVNCDPDFQGMGVGTALVKHFLFIAREDGAGGVHLVTGASARNRKFYERMGFAERAHSRLNGNALVLLGKKL